MTFKVKNPKVAGITIAVAIIALILSPDVFGGFVAGFGTYAVMKRITWEAN